MQNLCIFVVFSILSCFLDKQPATTIDYKASQKEFYVFCFSIRTKVYKMRFDSSTLNSIGDVPLGEVSAPWRPRESLSVTQRRKVFLWGGEGAVLAEAGREQSEPHGKVAVTHTESQKQVKLLSPNDSFLDSAPTDDPMGNPSPGSTEIVWEPF